MERLDALKATVKSFHGCDASHTRTERVVERFRGEVVWEGDVEVFALAGHSEALRCYAWGFARESGEWEITTVLAIPPVISAVTAVKAAIIAKTKATLT